MFGWSFNTKNNSWNKFVFCRSAIKPKLLAMRTSAVIRVAEYHSCAVSALIHNYLLLPGAPDPGDQAQDPGYQGKSIQVQML